MVGVDGIGNVVYWIHFDLLTVIRLSLGVYEKHFFALFFMATKYVG